MSIIQRLIKFVNLLLDSESGEWRLVAIVREGDRGLEEGHLTSGGENVLGRCDWRIGSGVLLDELEEFHRVADFVDSWLREDCNAKVLSIGSCFEKSVC